jgi:hypothetical protein
LALVRIRVRTSGITSKFFASARRPLVCVWDAFGKEMEMDLLPGGTCAGKPCWKASGTKGFKYKDKATVPDGLTGAKLKAGTAGKSQVQAKGKGANLPSPVLPLGGPRNGRTGRGRWGYNELVAEHLY